MLVVWLNRKGRGQQHWFPTFLVFMGPNFRESFTINCLKILADSHAHRVREQIISEKVVMILSDNSTVEVYTQHQSTTQIGPTMALGQVRVHTSMTHYGMNGCDSKPITYWLFFTFLSVEADLAHPFAKWCSFLHSWIKLHYAMDALPISRNNLLAYAFPLAITIPEF